MNFKRAISGMRIDFVAYAFVDDTDFIKMVKSELENINHAVYQMQKAFNTWAELIRATGGALIPEKRPFGMPSISGEKIKTGHMQP